MNGQTVTIKASRLLLLTGILIVLSVASLVVQLLAKQDITTIKKDTGEIKTKVVPLCLTAGALDACQTQIDAAPRPAVIRLCRLVVHELGGKASGCVPVGERRSNRSGTPDDGGGGANGTSGLQSDDQANVGSNPTSPGSQPANGGANPSGPGAPPDDGGGGSDPPGAGGDPTDPTDPGGGEQPGGEPGGEEPKPDIPDNGTCVTVACINIQGTTADDTLLPDDPVGNLLGGGKGK